MVQHTGVGAGKFLEVRKIFSQILPNLPEKNSIKDDLQRKALHVDLVAVGRYFCSDVQRFYEGFQRFCPDFHRFLPDFHQIKTFEGAFAPPPPTPAV